MIFSPRSRTIVTDNDDVWLWIELEGGGTLEVCFSSFGYEPRVFRGVSFDYALPMDCKEIRS